MKPVVGWLRTGFAGRRLEAVATMGTYLPIALPGGYGCRQRDIGDRFTEPKMLFSNCFWVNNCEWAFGKDVGHCCPIKKLARHFRLPGVLAKQFFESLDCPSGRLFFTDTGRLPFEQDRCCRSRKPWFTIGVEFLQLRPKLVIQFPSH